MRPREFVKTAYALIEKARRFFIIGIFSFIVVAGAVEIFLRYTPGMKSLGWSDEIMRYLNIWLVFLGASLAAKTNSHMAMDFFVRQLFPAALLPLVHRITQIITCAALLALMWVGLIKTLGTREVMIQALDIPIAWFYAAIPVGCLLMFVEYALQLACAEPPVKLTEEAGQ